MDEKQIWKEWQPVDDELDQLLRAGLRKEIFPRQPLDSLQRAMGAHLGWSLAITLAYVVLLFLFPSWQIVVALLITILFNIRVMWGGWKCYRSLKQVDVSTANLLQVLKNQHAAISGWGRWQLRLSLFVYPVAIIGGYLLGGVMHTGLPVEALLQQKRFVYVLPLIVLILMPLSYFLSKYLFQKSFGVQLDRLQDTIRELER